MRSGCVKSRFLGGGGHERPATTQVADTFYGGLLMDSRKTWFVIALVFLALATVAVAIPMSQNVRFLIGMPEGVAYVYFISGLLAVSFCSIIFSWAERGG